MPSGTPSTLSTPLKCFLKRMKQKRPQEKNLKFKKFKKNNKNKKKIWQIFFCFNFSKLPPKSCPGGRSLHPQRPQCVFEEDEAEVAAESFVKLSVRGQIFFFYFQLSAATDWVLVSADFRILESNDNINTFLYYISILLNFPCIHKFPKKKYK